MKCTNCIFCATFQDMSASFRVCLFENDNEIRTPDNYPNPCPNKFTTDEAREIVLKRGNHYCCTDKNKQPPKSYFITDIAKGIKK